MEPSLVGKYACCFYAEFLKYLHGNLSPIGWKPSYGFKKVVVIFCSVQKCVGSLLTLYCGVNWAKSTFFGGQALFSIL